MRLYLLRHAPALSRNEWDAPDDLRPLSSVGEDLARAVAARIAAMDLGLAAILTSPYERALRTATLVSECLDGRVPLAEDERLAPSQFTPSALARVLADHKDACSLMLVGHEPSMSEVLADIVGGGRVSFRKCGLARVDVDPASPRSGVLRWFVPPRLLR